MAREPLLDFGEPIGIRDLRELVARLYRERVCRRPVLAFAQRARASWKRAAAAILLRGLGRMQELPTLDWFADEARAIYGRAWNPAAIVRRYGEQVGYWTYYVKTGAPRLA